MDSKTTTPNMATADAYDAEIQDGAIKYTASLFLGRGKFANAEAISLNDIREAAKRLKEENPQIKSEPIITAFDEAGNQAVIGEPYKGKAKAPAKPKKAKAAKPKAAKKPAAPKEAKKADGEKAPRKLHPKHQAMIDAAAKGKLPEPPDFSAATHASYRKKLEALIAAAKKGDLAALKADTTEPKCSSRVPLCRYRDYAIQALETRAAKKAGQ